MPKEPREAKWVDSLPDGEEGSRYFAVGRNTYHLNADGKAVQTMVTRINVQFDVPGMHCDLGRVFVWSGDHMIAELPLHHVSAVGYPAPEGGV